MKILLIDNYDSFTYNLVQLIGQFTSDIVVKRNDKITIEELIDINPKKVVISPGPGRPENSNISIEIINELGKEIPILGVCLGHQGIAYCYGARIINAPVLMHGKTSLITHDSKTIYQGLEQNLAVGRYHSLSVDESTLPYCLEVTSRSEDGTIMGIRHKDFPIEGIQFHPESVLTPEGHKLMENWLYKC